MTSPAGDPWAVRPAPAPAAPPRPAAGPLPEPPEPPDPVDAVHAVHAGDPPPPAETPWLRLHPLTPLLRGGRLLALVAVVLYQQVLREAGFRTSGGLLAAALPVAVAYGCVSWWRTRYRLGDGDLQVETGVLMRRSRRVPLARLQAVDVVRGPVARLAGLAELRLEVVGGGRSEAPLAYLAVAEAAALRERLLLLAGVGRDPTRPATDRVGLTEGGAAGPPTGRAAPADPAPPAPPGTVPLLAVPTTRLLGATLLTAPALAAGVLLVAAAVTLAADPGAAGAVTAGLVPALLASGGLVARRLAGEWGFRLTRGTDALLLRHGLVETRVQTIPRDRVQGVRVVEPWLWRPLGWVRVEVDVAGYGSQRDEEQARTRALAPVAPRGAALRVLAAALPATDAALLAGVLTRDDGLRAAPPPGRARALAPASYPRLGIAVGASSTATTGGVLDRVTALVPHAKVQSLRLTQGPLQRRLDLASLHLDTAGRYVVAVAPHRAAREADALLALLVERVAEARDRGDPGSGTGRAGSGATGQAAGIVPSPTFTPPGSTAPASTP